MSISVNRLLRSNLTPSVAPSVYIAYHNLLAYVSCPFGPTVARGKSYNTTIAYAPNDLSTAMSARPQQTECTYIQVNYTMLGDFSSTEPDFFLPIPSSLASLDPSWGTCTPALYGAWDPPTTLKAATALTDPANKITPSTPAAPGSRSTPIYAPATKSVATNDPTTETLSIASTPGAAQSFTLPKTKAVEPADPTSTPKHCSTADLGCRSESIGGTTSGYDEKQYPNDPTNHSPGILLGSDAKLDHSNPSLSSPVSGFPACDEHSLVQAPSGDAEVGAATYMTKSKAHIPGQDLSMQSSAITMSGKTYLLPPPSTSIPPLLLINGNPIARVSDGGLILASSTVKPGKQATISGHTVSVGISDVVIDVSKYLLPTRTAGKSEQIFGNGAVIFPDSDPNDFQTRDHGISADQPAFTIPGATVSIASSMSYTNSLVPPFQAETNSSGAELGYLLVSPSQDGNHSTTRNRSSRSDAVVFTGGTSRSPRHLLSFTVFTRAMEILTIINLVP